MGDAELLEAMTWILFSRAYDERATRLQRQGRYGVFSQGWGQEAAIVGSAMALDPKRDWIVPQYRELAAWVRHGYPLERIAASFLGKAFAGRIPEGVRMLPLQVALAAQLPHAVGLAWGLQLQHQDGVALVYFGEGASSEGDFHEALNLAGVVKAPVIFFLQDNQWAISTPRRLQSAAHRLALRGPGFGIPGIAVDGNDLLAVYEATATAVARARAGSGPSLIEAVTYRLGVHNTSDNPTLYEDAEARQEAIRLEPMARLRSYLATRGLWDEAQERELALMVDKQVADAMQAARDLPALEPPFMFENIYVDPPSRVLRQRADAFPARQDS
jgi:pyruvate dehydrogenase E1 component alpha subunit